GEANVEEPDPDIVDPRGSETFEVYQSLIGLDGVMKRALERAGVKPRLREKVTAVIKQGTKLGVCTTKETITADHVVFATDPTVAARIIDAGKLPLAALVATLRKLEYSDLPITMQKGGSCWLPSDGRYTEAINTIVDGDLLRFTAWFGPLRATYGGGKKIPVFKSWGSPSLDPKDCKYTFFTHQHRIMMPTTAFMKHRAAVAACQGKLGLWFVGGWTRWFDSQEAALDSATDVAERIPGKPRPGTGSATMVPFDRDAQRRRIDRWLHRIAARAPLARRKKLRALMNEVEAKG
ncbi:MAG TPA: FAD-dependent oxidoreductase, partial [Nannocystaceae bacterium]|nr:FAD-dependent oxidoreductase [Nannocystaceae bacterium]